MNLSIFKRVLEKDVPFNVATTVPPEYMAEAQAALDWWITKPKSFGGTWGQVAPAVTESDAEGRYRFVLVGFNEDASGRLYEFRIHPAGGSGGGEDWIDFDTPEQAVESIPDSGSLLYRGMSHEEYEAMMSSGTVRSSGSIDPSKTVITDGRATTRPGRFTYFATGASRAKSYATNYLRVMSRASSLKP